MDTKVNYALVGMFVIALAVAMVMGFFWLSGFTHHKSYHCYLVYAKGGVTGLNEDSPILFNGVRVGSVDKIELDSRNPQFVKLYLKIDSHTPINQSTVATLIPQGITGLVYVGLKAETPEAPPLTAEPGQRYPVIPYQKPLLIQITEVLPSLTTNVSEIAQKFKQVFNDTNLNNFRNTLAHLEKITRMLDKQSDSIRSSLNSLDTVLKNSANASRHFESVMTATQKTVTQLDQTSRKVSSGVEDIQQMLMPDVQELLSRFNNITTNLQQVSDDLQRNPAVLIRGKQSVPPGPGE